MIIYMAHPVAGDVLRNIENAKIWLNHLARENHGKFFVAPWISWAEAYPDADKDPKTREAVLQNCEWQIGHCDQFWMVGPHISSGMERERRFAYDNKILIVDKTGTITP